VAEDKTITRWGRGTSDDAHRVKGWKARGYQIYRAMHILGIKFVVPNRWGATKGGNIQKKFTGLNTKWALARRPGRCFLEKNPTPW